MKRTADGEVDRLSDLPEHLMLHILSFLPTKFAARTSLLSRRLRRLWEASPVLDLDLGSFRDFSDFVDVANRTILHRDPLSPLHRLRIGLPECSRHFLHFGKTLHTTSYISSLLLKASSLGLRHLTVHLGRDMLESLTPLIFSLSLSSLEFLSLDRIPLIANRSIPLPSFPITQIHLRRLSITTSNLHNDTLNHIISHLVALEDLHLNYIYPVGSVDLKSETVKRLKLVLNCQDLKISTPSLEFFEVGCFLLKFKYFHWEMPMPLLKKFILHAKYISAENVPAICEMLHAIAHVEVLHLHIHEHLRVKYPFHALLVAGVELPTYFTLKRLNLEVCFHEYNIENLVTLLEHSPALESLKLVHKPTVGHLKDKNMELWRCKLPRIAEGNYGHAYLKDLQIDEKRKELIEQLTRKDLKEAESIS